MNNVFVGDYGFNLDFPSEFDLSSMDSVRMLIRQPGGDVVTYDFTAQEFAGVGTGGTLSYLVRSGDLPVRGRYQFQVVSKDSGADLGFQAFEIEAKPRLAYGWT